MNGTIRQATETRTIKVAVERITCGCGYPLSMDAGHLQTFLVATGWKERDGKWTCNHCESASDRGALEVAP